MQLIIHADDFGLSNSINEAVLELCNIGSVTSVSVMANMPFLDDCIKLLEHRRVSIGLHSTFTQGKPISNPKDIPSLVNEQGCFLTYNELRTKSVKGKVSISEIVTELRSQVAVIKEKIGNRLTMIDCHHGLHVKLLPFLKAFKIIGKEFAIPVIRTGPHYYIKEKKAAFILKKPSVINIAAFGLKKVAINYFRVFCTWHYSSVFKLANGMIIQENNSGVGFLRSLTKLNPNDNANQVFFVEVHPSNSIEGLTDTNIMEQRVEEFEYLRSREFLSYLKNGNIISFGNL